jgi:hypothetical protein
MLGLMRFGVEQAVGRPEAVVERLAGGLHWGGIEITQIRVISGRTTFSRDHRRGSVRAHGRLDILPPPSSATPSTRDH